MSFLLVMNRRCWWGGLPCIGIVLCGLGSRAGYRSAISYDLIYTDGTLPALGPRRIQ